MTARRPTLVYGIAITGEAIARALVSRGHDVVLADDAVNPRAQALATELGVDLVEAPDAPTIRSLVASVDAVLPAPGVPETHAVVTEAMAHDVPVRTELDVAYEWEQHRPGGPRPMIGITGTDGKTTTTLMVAALLEAGGLRAAAVGNTEVPLVAALDDPVDAFAVECSSFRLAFAHSFRTEAAIWLNLAPDHQNWHRTMGSYEAAKARIWQLQRPDDVAIGWVGDPAVLAQLDRAPGRHVTFGLDGADYRAVRHDDGTTTLHGPAGELAHATSLQRAFPHDITNALAAAAACVEARLVAPDRVDAGLAAFRLPPHRIEPLGTVHGIEWFNDSKATSPHAALTAIRSFQSIVLIAGGRNKGLDLSSLAGEADRIRAVVAIGESAADIEAAFAGTRPVEVATSMAQAVAAAERLARPGDVVLLSPACASFDWYPEGGYPARGDDFRGLVEQLQHADRSACRMGGAA
ncbi:MAG: UDP-N-acetylmuramoyl-L-alanine--D-glutamate ligase [Actinobacteria bacterium]|nr:UDP-N-acetylmuramoyl-L-alanine--D-glutamate ligase [Actinomycetota bacterium]